MVGPQQISSVACPYCGARVPFGSFCGACGHAFVAPQPQQSYSMSHNGAGSAPLAQPGQPMPTPTPPARPQAPTPFHAATHGYSVPLGFPPAPGSLAGPSVPSFGGWRPAAARKSVVTSVVVIAALLTGGYLVFGGNERHTVTGALSVIDSSNQSLSAGDSCSGTGGYDDITAGAQVTVTNESGTTLATGNLGQGTFDGSACVFDFTIPKVGKAKFYRVSAGKSSRGGPQYSYQDMTRAHWSAQLTLGS
jgi:hypothetical protein